jgi:hypothetical protein
MSLKAGAKRSAARPPFLGLVLREKTTVGKWETCFWFSTFPRLAGAVGMWESRFSRFPRAGGNEGNLGLVFLVSHEPVISTALLGFFMRYACAASGRIACVSPPAFLERPWCRISRRLLAATDRWSVPHGEVRPARATAAEISQGVAYQRYTRFCLPLALVTTSGTPHGRWKFRYGLKCSR